MKKLKYQICKGCLHNLNYHNSKIGENESVSSLLCEYCEQGSNLSPITVDENYPLLVGKIDFIVDREGIDYLKMLQRRRDWKEAKNQKRRNRS